MTSGSAASRRMIPLIDQICALRPSTKQFNTRNELESSEARNNAAFGLSHPSHRDGGDNPRNHLWTVPPRQWRIDFVLKLLGGFSGIVPSVSQREKESVWSSESHDGTEFATETQTPFRPPLIVSSRVLGVLRAPLVPVNSVCYR